MDNLPEVLSMIAPNYPALIKFLEKIGLEAQVQESSPQSTQLVFALHPDQIDDPLMVSFILQPFDIDEQGIQELLTLPEPPSNYYHAQLLAPLPVFIANDALLELSRLIMFINKSLEHLGFEYSEAEGIVYFKMSWMVTSQGMDPYLFIHYLHYLEDTLEAFAEPIQLVAQGKTTVKQYFENLIDEVGKD